ncbi:MAG TPA: hypothetical protein P5207_08855 [Candidatus Sabulitectum sp.]|nr:hypothetical protein [Candidatus Sabulitectum sp.]
MRLFERRRDRTEIPIDAVKKQLEKIAREGGFKAALLATREGFDVVETESGIDSSILAALAGLLFEMSTEIRDFSGARHLDHLTMSGPRGDAVICRFFDLMDQPVALIIITEMQSRYRELTDRAVDGIKRILEKS